MSASTVSPCDAVLAAHAAWIAAFDATDPSERRPTRVGRLPPLCPEHAVPTPLEVLEAERDAYAEVASALLFEVTRVYLARLSGDEIREQLDGTLALFLPEPIVAELRHALNHMRARCRELGIDPEEFIAPAGSRRAAA